MVHKKKTISIIIPSYNESESIRYCLEQIHLFLKKDWKYQVIVSDDGSIDDTKDIVWDYIFEHKDRNVSIIRSSINQGKGRAVYNGIMQAKYGLVLILDADLSVSPIELRRLKLRPFMKDDFIIKGQRLQREKQPLYRLFVGKCWKILVFFTIGIYMDTQCPFTLMKLPADFFDDMAIDGFAFDVEILKKAKAMNIEIYPVIVDYYNNENSSVTLKKTWQMFLDLIKISLSKS